MRIDSGKEGYGIELLSLFDQSHEIYVEMEMYLDVTRSINLHLIVYI